MEPVTTSNLDSLKIISRGSESIVYESKEGFLIKYRMKKSYRIKEIDLELRSKRTKFEKKILEKLEKNGVKVPKIFYFKHLDLTGFPFEEEFTILMEKIEINEKCDSNLYKNQEFLFNLGVLINSMHNLNVIHGDLTPLNVLKNDFIYIIDFGLSFISVKSEDKAVDLYVLEKSVDSMFGVEIKSFYDGYLSKSDENSLKVIEKLKEVRKRGRKKD